MAVTGLTNLFRRRERNVTQVRLFSREGFASLRGGQKTPVKVEGAGQMSGLSAHAEQVWPVLQAAAAANCSLSGTAGGQEGGDPVQPVCDPAALSLLASSWLPSLTVRERASHPVGEQ